MQDQLRQHLVAAILAGQLPPGQRLPSSRKLAERLGISRNTAVLAYQGLVDEGYIVSRERSGLFVSDSILAGRAKSVQFPPLPKAAGSADWTDRIKLRLVTAQSSIKPLDWRKYRYPFIYGQVDPGLFPLSTWRRCSRQALGTLVISEWVGDRLDSDDPFLIEQIRTRDLPRRGVWANPENILVTLGVQHALYLIASLLFTENTRVALENPGYVEPRNIFRTKTMNLFGVPVDEHGIVVDARLANCDYVYVTPSHQAPTTVTMPLERRLALIECSKANDFVIIEDDHSSETNYLTRPTMALKSLDETDRVIYIGSFSKFLSPGLRMGYIVGPRELIQEARRLRRLMMRHPPSNNERTLALFLAGGHYDALIHRLHTVYYDRWKVMREALERHLPGCARIPTFGGTSYWVEGPEGLDADILAKEALRQSLVLEPGSVHFLSDNPPRNYFRLGFSSIPVERIEPGIKLLRRLIHERA